MRISLRAFPPVLPALLGAFGLLAFAVAPLALGQAGAPSCALSASKSSVSAGEKVTLRWRISGEADDGIMSPPLGPDVDGFDLAEDGRAQTPPLSADTRFTLTVSNDAGASSCFADVQVSNGSSEVQFLRTIFEIPVGTSGTNAAGGNQKLVNALYWNDHFVIAGQCGGGVNGDRQGGMWLARADGTFLDERDACMDGGSKFMSIFFHGTAMPFDLEPDGTRGFVREIQSLGGSCSGSECNTTGGTTGSGAYTPVYYEVSGGRLRPVSTLIRLLSPNENSIPIEERERRWAANIVVANGYAYGTRIVGSGPSARQRLVTFRLPTWSEISSVGAEFTPHIGFGQYVLGIPKNGIGLKVYKANDDGSLVFVHDLNLDGAMGGAPAIDHTTTPNTIAFAIGPDRLDRSRAPALIVFRAGANGLEQVSRTEIPPGVELGPGFSIGLGYLASPSGTKFNVYKGMQKIASISAPPNSKIFGSRSGNTSSNVWQTIIAPNGNLLVTTIFGGAYLYKLGAGAPAPSGPPAGPLAPPAIAQGLQLSGIQDYLAFAQSYVQLLQALLGATSGGAPKSALPGAAAPDEGSSFDKSEGGGAVNPQINSIFQQFIDLINSY